MREGGKEEAYRRGDNRTGERGVYPVSREERGRKGAHNAGVINAAIINEHVR
jgi:hypothetical protein